MESPGDNGNSVQGCSLSLVDRKSLDSRIKSVLVLLSELCYFYDLTKFSLVTGMQLQSCLDLLVLEDILPYIMLLKQVYFVHFDEICVNRIAW